MSASAFALSIGAILWLAVAMLAFRDALPLGGDYDDGSE